MGGLLLLRGLPLFQHVKMEQYEQVPVKQRLLSRGRAYYSSDKSHELTLHHPPPKYPRWDDPHYRKWKDKESLILQDVHPIISRSKLILHSNRYMDGERLSLDDEKAVIDKLLSHHPHFQHKIGCGLDSIMVDRHPQFKQSRCLFVVRTDGGWIDFSYQKCLRAYIRDKYPSDAERFIKEHFKRGSG